MGRRSLFVARPVAVALTLGAAPAAAQTAPSLDTRAWRPTMDPQGGLVLEPATSPGPWQANVALWASYALDPVAVRDGSGRVLARPIEHQVMADVTGGIGIGDRFAVGVDAPVAVWQEGAGGLDPRVAGGGRAPTSARGDLALLGKATVLSNERKGLRGGLGLAALAAVTFPTGDRQSFIGEGAVTASLRLLAEYALGAAALRASLGFALRPYERRWPDDGTGPVFGSAVPWALGLSLHPKLLLPVLDADDRQVWELAAHGAVPAGPVAPFVGSGASLLSPASLALDDHVAIGHYRDFYVIAGVEIGLDSAVGVPAFRGVASFGWAPRSHDRDGDGVPDDLDQCPDLPEDRDGIQDQDGCPEDDADGDGIEDDQDACPLIAGVPSSDPHRNGCAP